MRELRGVILDLGLPVDEVSKMLRLDQQVSSRSSRAAATSRRRNPPRRSSAHGTQRLLLTERVMAKFDKSGDQMLDMQEFSELLAIVVATLTRTQPLDRNQGAWALPSADVAEPARTERLLARPFAIWRSHAPDVVDQVGFPLWFRTHGRSKLGVLWCWSSMMVQALLAVISGVGPYLTRSSTAADVQVLSVAAVKLLWVLVLVSCVPCNDYLVNRMTIVMFSFEGAATILVYMAAQATTSPETAAVAQDWAFNLLLFPVFMPMCQFLYDGIIVTVIVSCWRKKFTLKILIIWTSIICLSIPSFLARAFGHICPGLSTFSSSNVIGASVMFINDAEKQIKAQRQKPKPAGNGDGGDGVDEGDGGGAGDGGGGDGG
jgi:hypothetical protein